MSIFALSISNMRKTESCSESLSWCSLFIHRASVRQWSKIWLVAKHCNMNWWKREIWPDVYHCSQNLVPHWQHSRKGCCVCICNLSMGMGEDRQTWATLPVIKAGQMETKPSLEALWLTSHGLCSLGTKSNLSGLLPHMQLQLHNSHMSAGAQACLQIHPLPASRRKNIYYIYI